MSQTSAETATTRLCSKCERELPATEFRPGRCRKAKPGYRRPDCMECENAAARELRAKKHREAVRCFVRRNSGYRASARRLCADFDTMAARFGSVDKFLEFWYAEFNAACERRPGSRYVLANVRLIAKIVRFAAAQRAAQAAGQSLDDVGDLTAEELQCELVGALTECEGVEIPEQDAFVEDEPEPSNTAPSPTVVTDLPVATDSASEEPPTAVQAEPSEQDAEVNGRVAFPHDLVKTAFIAAVNRVLNRYSAPPTCHLHPDVGRALRNGPRGFERTPVPYGVKLVGDPSVSPYDANGEFHFEFKDERGRPLPHR